MYLFLINPEAGQRKFARIEKRLRRALDRNGVKYRFVMIDNLARVPELIQQNLRASDKGVVAVGGNATVNAIINALVNENVPIGVIPMSRTNHLAYSLGLKHLPTAIKALVDYDLKSERLGKIGQHYFVGNVDVTTRPNLLAHYLTKTSPWLKFLGLGSSAKTPTDEGVATTVELDDEIKVYGKARRLQVSLNGDQNPKKLRLTMFASPDPTSASILHSDAVMIDGETKMPVLLGNETVAHTPIAVKGLTKYIRLIVPRPKQLTEAKSS